VGIGFGGLHFSGSFVLVDNVCVIPENPSLSIKGFSAVRSICGASSSSLESSTALEPFRLPTSFEAFLLFSPLLFSMNFSPNDINCSFTIVSSSLVSFFGASFGFPLQIFLCLEKFEL
jgi:hypothetical protein